MRARAILMTFAVFASLGMLASPAAVAKSAAMTACSGQWDAMKKADKLPKDQTWAQFWSQCSKDFAAKNGTDTTAAKSSQKSSDTTPKEPKTNKKKVAVEDESDSTGSAQQKRDCDAKWGQNKASTGAHGWHDYFKFMAGCM
jgi:hypothetical protein